MIYDPKSQKALKTVRYSCVFSHLVSRPAESDYLVALTPGNKVLFIGTMKLEPGSREFVFQLLETFNLTSLFLNTEVLTLSERTRTQIEEILHTKVYESSPGNSVMKILVMTTNCQLYNI